MGREQALVKGWYGHNNLGDESYKLTFPKVFGSKYDLMFSDSSSLRNPHDAVFLGGGDIFVPDFTTPLIGHDKPCFAASVTLSEDACEDALNQMKYVAVRDKKSFNDLCDRFKGLAYYVPDFAFLLEGKPDRGQDLITRLFKEEKRDLYENKVVVVINSHLIAKPGDSVKKHIAFENFCFQIAEVCDTTNASFLFLPFSTQEPWDDRVSSGMVASRCKFWKKNLVAYKRMGVQDALDIISAANAVVSSRLHSTIFSCVGSTPFVDITHNHKNSRLLEDMDLMESSVNYYKLSPNSIYEKLDYALKDKGETREQLRLKVNDQINQIERFKDHVCSL